MQSKLFTVISPRVKNGVVEVLITLLRPQVVDVLAQCIRAGNSLGSNVFTGVNAMFTRNSLTYKNSVMF